MGAKTTLRGFMGLIILERKIPGEYRKEISVFDIPVYINREISRYG
jgi:hypothetical protein